MEQTIPLQPDHFIGDKAELAVSTQQVKAQSYNNSNIQGAEGGTCGYFVCSLVNCGKEAKEPTDFSWLRTDQME